MSNEVPERIFLRACHPANPNHNCTWSVSKESTQSVEYIRADLAAARIEQLEQALRDAKNAISSLPKESLGRDPLDGYFYRDELIAKIDAALVPVPLEQKEK